MYYKWSESIMTGDARIDAQHKALIEKLDLMLKHSDKSKDQDSLLEELRFFEHYVIEHFTDEEMLHKESGAPDFEAHVKAHEQLIQMTEALIHTVKMEGVTVATELFIYNGLMRALIQQVHAFDVPLASYINKRL